MPVKEDEDELLRTVALRNAQSILVARQRVEEELIRTKEALEAKSDELARSLAWLRVTLDSIGDGVITTDTQGRVTSMNPVAVSLTGWTQDQAMERPLEEVFPIVHEHTRERMENPATLALQQGIVVGLTNPAVLVTRDGIELPIDDSAAPIKDEQGHVAGCVLIFRDVTEQRQAEEALRQSEERYRSLAQATTSVVWTADAEGRFVTPQPSWSAYVGQTWDELRDLGWANAIHPNDRARVWKLWKAACASRTLYKADGRMWHAASASYRHFEARGVPLLNADGTVREWVGECVDVEDRKRAEEVLREADRHKNAFLAMLAHELRNPLATIHNAVQVMRVAGGNHEAVASASVMMDRQVGQMVRLVDDLLDVGRISRGKIELRRGRIELATAVNDAVDTVRSLCKSMSHELTIMLPPQPIHVDADPTRLAQVVGNLLNNACKFTERGGHIWLMVEREGEQVVIRVRDNGIGIAADQLPRIFDMFMQVDTSLERPASGLGIGLTLVKSLVEMHGGTVDVHSAGVGQGSQFEVRLPVLVETPQPVPAEPTIGPLPTKARRILVVDDNRDSAKSLAMLLKLIGNETHTAYDGFEAIEAAETFKPDVVLLDIGLPRLNGYETARKIRREPWGNAMSIVALTGWGQDEDRERSRDAGFNAHLVKPVALATLMKVLASLRADSPS